MNGPGEATISVAILTWNRREHVIKAIQSVIDQTYPAHEIVIVDSASTDGTPEILNKNFPDVRVIRLHENLGCPGGRNIALANCSGDFIFALDDDGWLAPNTLEVCVGHFARDKSLGVVACQILEPGKELPPGGKDTESSSFSGGAAAIRRQVLQTAGYYPQDFLRQAEEVDLTLRLVERGFTIVRSAKAVMYHARSPINRDDRKSMYYSTRNELYTVFRLHPWFIVLPGVLRKILIWNFAGLKAGAIHYTLGGTLAALAYSPKLLTQRSPVSWSTIRSVVSMRRKLREK